MSVDQDKKQLELPVAVLGAVLGVVRADLLQQDPLKYVAVPEDVRQWLSDLISDGEAGDFARNELKAA